MIIREILEPEKNQYNKMMKHPLQSWEWGEFRKKMGQEVIRLGVFEESKLISGYQILLNHLPKTGFTVGTLLRGPLPDQNMIDSLWKLGKEHKTVFIKLEPLVGGPIDQKDGKFDTSPKVGYENIKTFLLGNSCRIGKPLFPPHTFYLDLQPTEEQLLANMHPKTRYNLRLSQKYGVQVVEDNSPEGFETFLKLHFETGERESFFSHGRKYHQTLWETLTPAGISHILIAKYQNVPLTAWMLFTFNQALYYPYGGSTRKFREVMASYSMMWETIKFGKKMKCKNFDMWGTPGPNPKPTDPWYGFHRFKMGFNPQLIEFIGTYDLVLNPPLYGLYNLADNLRWIELRTKAKINKITDEAKNYASKYSTVTPIR